MTTPFTTATSSRPLPEAAAEATSSRDAPSLEKYLNEEQEDGDSPPRYDNVLDAAWGGLLPEEEADNDDATAMVEKSCMVDDEGGEEDMDVDSEEEEDGEKLLADLRAKRDAVNEGIRRLLSW